MPASLKTKPLWVNYNIEPGSPKAKKVPYDPTTGLRIDPNEPNTFRTFDICEQAFLCGRYHGVGFELVKPYAGIDLDNCRNIETEEIDPWAQEIIDIIDSYTEMSVSETGVHILCEAELPKTGETHNKKDWTNKKDGRTKGIEMYDHARFFVVTGDHLSGTPLTVNERMAEYQSVWHDIFPPAPAIQPKVKTYSAVNLSDTQIVQYAKRSKTGNVFSHLWAGEWEGLYGSHSDADLALCCHLAFWTGNDSFRIDSLFRMSGLCRDKWTMREDYRTRTIKKAIESTKEVFGGK